MKNNYVWLTELSQQFLDKEYLQQGETVDQRVNVIANTAEKILDKKGFAKKFIQYFKKGWYSLSTPIWTNFGTERGLPISCFGSHISDDTADILRTQAEVGMMSKCGGGTSAFFGNLRGRGAPIQNGRNGYSGGAVHFMQLFNTSVNVISQGSTRRGSFAAYLPVEHPDIMEFLTIKSEGSPIQDISYGVTVTDKWLNEMIDDDKEKRKIWAKVLESRNNLGFPYIFFTDNVNRGTVDVYKDKGLVIDHSNLCSEINLPNSIDESFVCDLASMNVLYYDIWKNVKDAVEVLVYLLDAVMTEFIRKAKLIPFLDKAARFAERHRALGIGWLGWHSYLQSNMIPFESMEAKLINTQVAKHIHSSAYAASAKMAIEYGEPEILKGYGRRHTTLLAIAPTKSSSFIIGQASESIQPEISNICIKDLAKGKFTIKNKYLEALLEEKGFNTDEVWDTILKNYGSVQHLEFLTQQEKDVFKTFMEISPIETVIQAASRQKYIDQSQSLNLLINPATPVKIVNSLVLEAWKLGIKTLYYQININAAQKLGRDILQCKSCEA